VCNLHKTNLGWISATLKHEVADRHQQLSDIAVPDFDDVSTIRLIEIRFGSYDGDRYAHIQYVHKYKYPNEAILVY
jgi:hypothetical protein